MTSLSFSFRFFFQDNSIVLLLKSGRLFAAYNQKSEFYYLLFRWIIQQELV